MSKKNNEKKAKWKTKNNTNLSTPINDDIGSDNRGGVSGDKKITTICGIVGTVGTLLGIVFAFFTYFEGRFQRLEDQMDKSMGEIEKEVASMDEAIYKGEDNSGIMAQLARLNGVVFPPTVVNSENQEWKLSIVDNDVTTVTSGITSATKIGTDADGKVYMANDLIDTRVILFYKEEDKEVFFLGQYNENYHWDGYCMTNVYNADGSLFGISESNFVDGERRDYTCFYQSEEDCSEYIYTNRVVEEEGNSGVSITYLVNEKTMKEFDSEKVDIMDFYFINEYLHDNNFPKKSYYSGYTKDGLYEDHTGNAYLVKFGDDGKVNTLYRGQFSKGKFSDPTENSWDIAYSNDIQKYICNSGPFKNGHLEPGKGESREMEIEEILQMMKDYEFDVSLEWRDGE
ncbi:MAG: hypothetical protein MR957_02720 [Lachnobacterium sp.]|nr:hypothetical protein [Lachnobacterium sp.]